MMNQRNLDAALSAWRDCLGSDAVRVSEECAPYMRNCIGVKRYIPAVLLPTSEEEVIDVIRVAVQHQIPLYPVSTGNNWGYGSANPVADNCVMVHLSRMNKIIEVDNRLGVVTLQPGVTQQQLRDYLDEHNLPFMVPVTGAGPNCSLLGNALERGFGITPYGDHFAAVTALRAILPNGAIYRSGLTEAGGTVVDRLYKWGVGPYIDGLFTQGSFGIVTEMTIALARLPESINLFLFELRSDADLGPVAESVRSLLQNSGGGISGINIMNRIRVLSMTEPYPGDQVPPGQSISEALIDAIGRQRKVPPWLGLGALYGDRAVVTGLRRAVRKRLKTKCRRVIFISNKQIKWLQVFSQFIPGAVGATTRKRVASIAEVFDILSGRPRETALRLAYWRSGVLPDPGIPLNPARDERGVLWYSPLVPMTADAANAYVDMVKAVCPRYGINPLITLTAINERCFDSTVPILFDPETSIEDAHACYKALFTEGQRRGFLPYRMGVQSMQLYTETPCSYWNLVSTFKQAVDPNSIISPGRYVDIRPKK